MEELSAKHPRISEWLQVLKI